MSRTRTHFTQAQVRRAVKAAESAGLHVKRVTIDPGGSITLAVGMNLRSRLTAPIRRTQHHGTTCDGADHGKTQIGVRQ